MSAVPSLVRPLASDVRMTAMFRDLPSLDYDVIWHLTSSVRSDNHSVVPSVPPQPNGEYGHANLT